MKNERKKLKKNRRLNQLIIYQFQLYIQQWILAVVVV